MRRDNAIRIAVVCVPGLVVLILLKPDTWPGALAFIAFLTILGCIAAAGIRRWG